MAVDVHRSLEVVAASGSLGAELRGIDLRDLDHHAFAEVRRALVEHEVIFVRDAFLTDDEHLALGARFGAVNIFPMSKLLGVTEPKLQVIVDGPDSRPAADDWHTDVT